MSEIISLINEKGGVGKSTSAITISQILAISGYNVLLIDLDPQMNTTKMFSNVDNIKDVYLDQLISVIDNRVEYTPDYAQRVRNEYGFTRARK